MSMSFQSLIANNFIFYLLLCDILCYAGGVPSSGKAFLSLV